MVEQQTIFGRTVDQKETKRKVEHFLKVDYLVAKRKSKLNMADISSQQIDGMPKSSVNGNAIENKLVNHIFYKQVVKAVKLTFEECSEETNVILKGLCFQNKTDVACYTALHCSESQYYKEVKPNAYLEFAEIYPIEDLLAFEDETNTETVENSYRI